MAEEKTRARAKERPKVDLDSAEADFDRFCKAFRLRKAMAGALDDAKDVVIQAIRGGAVTVDEKGQLNFQPGDDMDALVFHEPRGADLMAMDQKPEGHKIAALHACAASITRDEEKRFAQMDLRDAEIVYAIVGLLVGG